jgi:sugar lactone lactonase YvrE
MAPAIRCVHKAGALLGEGPVWVEREQALYWVDIKGRRIHRHDPVAGACKSFEMPFRVGSLAPRTRGGFVAGTERGFALVDETLSSFDVIGDPEPELPGNRFNDGKVDPQGRFWAGTMDDAEAESTGALYRLDPTLEWSCQDAGYRVTNGPAFSPDGRYLYHTDSAARTIYRFDLTSEGELCGKIVFAQFEAEHGHPDGMTTDRHGNLFIAFWDGWCIRQVSPAGEVVQTIELPVQRPTSCTYGGEGHDVLFVTSARAGLGESELEKQPEAGSLFSITRLGQGGPAPMFAG